MLYLTNANSLILKPSDQSRKSREPLSKENVKILEEWLNDNMDYPYPGPVDLDELHIKTSLSKKKIRVWLTNYRNVIKRIK